MDEPFTPSFFRSLQQLKIRTRRAVLGSRQGSHRSARRGHGLEFADYRVYSPGDDFRHIDWQVYGRTDRLYVREFREERELNVLILVDCSKSMAAYSEERKLWFARNLALSLGYVGLADGDTVRFVSLGGEISPRFIGPRALPRAIKFLNTAQSPEDYDVVSAVRTALSVGKLPGKCFFISDFLEEPERIFEACDLIRGKNYDLSLLQVLAPSEISPDFQSNASRLVDIESGEELPIGLNPSLSFEYAKGLAAHVQSLELYAARYGLSHVLISSADDFQQTVLTRLPQLRLLQ